MKPKYINYVFVAMTMAFLANAETISFKNFNHHIVYEKNEIGYLQKASQKQVTIAHRLIIKTSTKYNKKKILKLHSAITEVKELYHGKDFTYFLAEINKDIALQRVMKKLVKKRAVILVQTDILQKSEKSHDDDKDHKKARLNNRLKKPKQSKLQQDILRKKQLEMSLSRYLRFIGVEKLWEKTKGKGIKIAVIDDGFDLKHKEFEKLNLAFSYDASDKKLDSSPIQDQETHGTKIAGVLFAKHDATGVEGIAPEAELIAIRQPDTWTSNTLLSFQMAKLANADIINCSWNSPQLMQPIADVVNDLVKYGRNGKGTAVIFAAGNKGIELKPYSTEASIDSAIVVGASNFLSKRTLKFSNKGTSVDIMAFGKPVQSTYPNNKYGKFAGTSLSSTIVSGITALLMSQNPELTMKQLQIDLKNTISDKKRLNKFNLKSKQNKGNE